MDKNKIDVYEGLGSFSDRNTINVLEKKNQLQLPRIK